MTSTVLLLVTMTVMWCLGSIRGTMRERTRHHRFMARGWHLLGDWTRLRYWRAEMDPSSASVPMDELYVVLTQAFGADAWEDFRKGRGDAATRLHREVPKGNA